jgi:hypothetical protein
LADLVELAIRASLIGIGATLVLDLWSAFLNIAFRVPAPNYAMIGRWVGYFPRGVFTHNSIAKAAPVPGEAPLGWLVHYAVGVVYAAALIAIAGLDWAHAPTLMPALIFGILTIAAPFFVMQPAMGAGFAASKMPNPNAARLKSLMAHAVFGLGLYITAVLTARLFVP